MNKDELSLQEKYTWARSQVFDTYNGILGFYQVKSILENCHGNSLLDLPCGDALCTNMMSDRFTRIVGVDASEKQLLLAKKRMPFGNFHHSLLEDFHTDERFDTITMINVLEHVEDPIIALKHAYSLLNPGGVLIVHVPNANAINRRLAVQMGTLKDCVELSPFDINIAGHRRSYTMETFLLDIHKSGLLAKKTGGVFYKMLSTPQMDWFLKNGLWEDGGFGWGRVGEEKAKDWRDEFCRACYELGKEQPLDCNIIYACIVKA